MCKYHSFCPLLMNFTFARRCTELSELSLIYQPTREIQV